MKQSWGVTRGMQSLLDWCRNHPLPGIIALTGAVIIGLFAIVQGMDWAVSKLDRPLPQILGIEEPRGAGGNYSVTIENPTDTAMVVSEVLFRAVPPPDLQNANDIELMIPAVTYSGPYDCSPGTKRMRLNPPFKVPAKDVGAVVIRSTIPMRDCQLFISLETSQGQTKEQEAVSLGGWRTRAP